MVNSRRGYLRYEPSILTGEASYQDLATGQTIGKRFHSAPVIRLADAKPMQLGHIIQADARWHIFAFAGANDSGQPGSPIHRLCEFLEAAPSSPIEKYTREDEDIPNSSNLPKQSVILGQAERRSVDPSRDRAAVENCGLRSISVWAGNPP